MKLKWLLAFLLVLAAGFLMKTGNKPQHASEQPLTAKGGETVKKVKTPHRTSASSEVADAEEMQRLLKEAANRRFKVDKPEGMLTDDPDVRDDLTRQVAVEMLLETLLREKMDKDPGYLEATEARMLSRQPRLMTLKQADSQGEPREVQVLVADTRDCQQRLLSETRIEVRVADLTSDYCMHPTLEYPGGFDPERPLQLTVVPASEKSKFAEVDRQWERLLKVEMRAAITAEFVPHYKATGALTL